MSKELGNMIFIMRKQARMTQAELAKRCGLERTSITAIADALGYRVKIKFERKQ